MWVRPSQPNAVGALTGYIGVAAPLIAGFELAGVVTLITSDRASQLPMRDWGVLSLVVSTIAMVFAIQYGFWAVAYWSGPADVLGWDPRTGADASALTRARRHQAVQMSRFEALRVRAEWIFQVGLVSFLLGLALLLWPAPPAPWLQRLPAWLLVAAMTLQTLWVCVWRWHHWFVARYALPGAAPPKALIRLDGALLALVSPLWPPLRPPSYPVLQRATRADVLGLHDTPEAVVSALAERVDGANLVEYPLMHVHWNSDSSVTVGDATYQAFTFVSRPWALLGSGDSVMLIHPTGMMQGAQADVTSQLRVLRSYTPPHDLPFVDALLARLRG